MTRPEASWRVSCCGMEMPVGEPGEVVDIVLVIMEGFCGFGWCRGVGDGRLPRRKPDSWRPGASCSSPVAATIKLLGTVMRTSKSPNSL